MRRTVVLALALTLALTVVAQLIARWMPRLSELDTVRQLMAEARRSPKPVRRGEYLVLGPLFVGTVLVDSVRKIRVQVDSNRDLSIRCGGRGPRPIIHTYDQNGYGPLYGGGTIGTSSQSAFWQYVGDARIECRDGCVLIRQPIDQSGGDGKRRTSAPIPEREWARLCLDRAQAAERAGSRIVSAGFECLSAGLERAYQAQEEGKPWGAELTRLYQQALEDYVEQWVPKG